MQTSFRTGEIKKEKRKTTEWTNGNSFSLLLNLHNSILFDTAYRVRATFDFFRLAENQRRRRKRKNRSQTTIFKIPCEHFFTISTRNLFIVQIHTRTVNCTFSWFSIRNFRFHLPNEWKWQQNTKRDWAQRNSTKCYRWHIANSSFVAVVVAVFDYCSHAQNVVTWHFPWLSN